MLLSSKCDTSGCQGCWHHCLLQRPFSGRADWNEVSLVNAIPATSLWGWARAGRRQQYSRPVVLQSWAAVASLLALLACFMPSSHVWFHPPWRTLSHPPASNWYRQTSVSAAFLLFEQKVSSGQWGHIRNMSLPCLLTAMRGTRRPPHKEMGRAKILLNREAKKVECETWCPQVRGKFPMKSHEASPSAPRTGGRKIQELENVQKEAGFLFS